MVKENPHYELWEEGKNKARNSAPRVQNPLSFYLQPCISLSLTPTAFIPIGLIPISYTINLESHEMEGKRNLPPWQNTEKRVGSQHLPVQI